MGAHPREPDRRSGEPEQHRDGRPPQRHPRLLGRRGPPREGPGHACRRVRLRRGPAPRAAPRRGRDPRTQHRLPAGPGQVRFRALRPGAPVPVHRRLLARPSALPADLARRPPLSRVDLGERHQIPLSSLTVGDRSGILTSPHVVQLSRRPPVSRFTSYLRSQVRRLVMARISGGGIDLSRLDKVPDTLAWPLHRDGVDLVERLGELRAEQPVAKLTSFMGLNVWLVTGDAESRQVLADTTSYSNDIRPFVGRRGAEADGDIGGLGFTDPPEHTRLRKLLTPEFTMRRLERLRPRIADIVERQLDEVERQAAADGGGGGPLAALAVPLPLPVVFGLLGPPPGG